MKIRDIKFILDKYSLTGEQIKKIEAFDEKQLANFISSISNSDIIYMDAVIRVIEKRKEISLKQLDLINSSANEKVAKTFAEFIVNNKCSLSDANKLALMSYVNGVNNIDVGIESLNIIWQMAEAGVTREDEEKYVILGRIIANCSDVEHLSYIKEFLYTLYPKACYRETIDKEVRDHNDIERDVINILTNCHSNKIAFVYKILSGLINGTRITTKNYERFINTLDTAANLESFRKLEAAGKCADLFAVAKENRQLNYINAILNSASIQSAECMLRILEKSNRYLNDTVYETPELLSLVKLIGSFDENDVYRLFGNKFGQEINKRNIPAALYMVKHRDDHSTDYKLTTVVLSVLGDKDDYMVFDELYEENRDAAVEGLNQLAEKFPDMEFSSGKTYVKKIKSSKDDDSEE